MRVDNCYGIAFSKVMRATYGVCTVLYIEYRISNFEIRYSIFCGSCRNTYSARQLFHPQTGESRPF